MLKKIGNFLGRHQKAIRRLQWIIIIFYAALIIIPVCLPLPDDSARLFHNLTVFAQFLFWGIWWPFVLLSIILFGRLWCGVLCPEGALSEFANRYGRGRSIPRWMRWGGWPFVAFSLTTLYGQLTSVYQYPKPTLLILGGSTLAAIVIGFIYGRSSRLWCKYLCPVTGVFALLARLSPIHYKTDPVQWQQYSADKVPSVRCPTLLPIRTMKSAAGCLMCGRCANHRNAVALTLRSPYQEIIVEGHKHNSIWESLLILYGLCGLALAAFQWSNSFWFDHLRNLIDSWFLVHNQLWAFNTNSPWFILTHYPDTDDVFSWLFGFEVLGYIVGMGVILGTILLALISLAVKVTGPFTLKRVNHLSLALIPLGGCSVFIGLCANTLTILQKYANLGFLWMNDVKAGLLALATLWSLYLAIRILRNAMGLFMVAMACAVVNYSWFLVLHIWTMKADSIPWDTLWVW